MASGGRSSGDKKLQALAVLLVLALAGMACGLPASKTALPPTAVGQQSRVQPSAPAQADTPSPAASLTGTLTQPPAQTFTPTQPPTHTFTPTQTRTSTSTPTPTEPPSISPGSNDGVPPEDVIQEIGITGVTAAAYCRLVHREDGAVTLEGERELMEIAAFNSTGWTEGEGVNVTVFDPNQNQVASFQTTAGGLWGASVRYRALLNQPAGAYRFVLQGPSGRQEVTQIYRVPSGPQIYHLDAQTYQDLSGMPGQGEYIYLWGFAPGESVQVLTYLFQGGLPAHYVFQGAHTFQVDPQGQLFITLQGSADELKNYVFAALGKKSGEVHGRAYSYCGERVDVFNQRSLTCPGAPPNRVNENDTIRMAGVRRLLPLRRSSMPVYKNPRADSPVVAKLTSLQEAGVNYGPRCVDSTLWWQIFLPEGSGASSGWVPESAGKNYLIEPVKK